MGMAMQVFLRLRKMRFPACGGAAIARGLVGDCGEKGLRAAMSGAGAKGAQGGGLWRGGAVPCLLAMAASVLLGWALNGVLYASVASYFGIARELNTLFFVALYVVLHYVSRHGAGMLDCRLLTAVAAFLLACSVCILFLAVEMQNRPMTLVGLLLFSAGRVWTNVLLGVALCGLPSFKAAAASVALGTTLGDAVQALDMQPPFALGMALMAGLGLAVMALTYRRAAPFFVGRAPGAKVADMELAQPKAFLAPGHALFGCILLFGVASGFGLTLNEVMHAPIGVGLAGSVALLVVSWLVWRGDERGEDALFSFAILLVIAGFVVAPFVSGSESATANALIRLGTTCFSILMWLVLVSIGKQNAFALVPSLCIVEAAHALGVLAGAVAGHSVNDLALTDGHLADAIVAVGLFAFVAFLWVGLRRFSFTDTIGGIERPVLEQGGAAAEAESVEGRCRELGERHGLTERETEIFAMLARGRNGSFVQSRYVISRNTVKTHVKHIYRKLGVHSQQELIDLVEAAAGAGAPAGGNAARADG